MSLTFLVPLFLAGIAAVVVPIVVHLTRRQRRRVVHFPSLMFLERIPFREQRRRRIQHWFLLAMRALALTLLAIAFARPFLDQSDVGLAATAGPREVVVLLDQSYSMAIGDQLERAKAEARTVFDGLGPLDRASVVLFDDGARVVARSTSERSRLRTAVDSATAGSGATRYGPALKVAQTILEESTLHNGEVFLLSDFQRNGWTGDEGVRLPAGTRVVPVPLGEPLTENVQVTGVSLPRQTVTGRERVTATARLVRRGGDEPREVDVTLELDGRPNQTRSVTLQPDAATTVTFQPFTLSQPHTRGAVRVPADALEADNAHHFVLSPGAAVTVLVVGGGSGADPNLYLTRALGISDDGRFRVVARRGNGVAPEALAEADAVILNDTRVDGASAERLREFMVDGGGVLLALGENATWPTSAADMLPAALGPVQDRVQGRGGRLGYLEYGHPVFEVFSGPRSGDFTTARFFRARGLTLSDSASVLARFDDGSIALAESRVGQGRMLVWSTTLDAYWNDLALQPVYLPFMHRIVEHLSGQSEAVPWFMHGQVVDLADPDALETAGLVSSEAAGLAEGLDQLAITPAGATIEMPAGSGPRYLPLDERGFYTVRPPGSEPARPFVMAVNVDLAESNLARIDPEELVLQVSGPPVAADAGPAFSAEAASLQRQDQERRQSLWRWILLGALALLIGETIISNWISRRSPGAPGLVTG